MRVAAVVPDLMDRSRLRAEGVEVTFVKPGEVGSVEADLLVVDLSRPAALAALVSRPTGLRAVGFGPHVDDELLAAATAAGCDAVLPRSRFFARWPEV